MIDNVKLQLRGRATQLCTSLKDDFVKNEPWLVLLLSTIFAVIGGVVARVSPGQAGKQFIQTPEYLIWLATIVVLVGAYPALSLACVRSVRELPKVARPWRMGLAVMLFLLLCAAMPLATSIWITAVFPMSYHKGRFVLIMLLGVLTCVAPATCGIWRCHQRAKTLIELRFATDAVAEYMKVRSALQTCLSVLGIVVALATLATGAQRHALIVWWDGNDKKFPLIFVFVYGAYFTLLTALAYLPASESLARAGNSLLDTMAPFGISDSDWEANLRKREALAKHLSLDASVRTTIEAAVPILAPVATGLMAYLLK